MNIKISICMTGPDQWTCESSLFGQTQKSEHSFEVTFKESDDQIESFASALLRIIKAVDPPRPLMLVASLVKNYEDHDQLPEETALIDAAEKLIKMWSKIDED